MPIEPCPVLASRRSRRALVIACFMVVALPGARANPHSIQKCRIDGRLVLQSGPCPQEASVPAFAPAPASAPAPGTQPSAASWNKVPADARRERDSTQPAPAPPREPQIDGAKVLRSRMGAV